MTIAHLFDRWPCKPIANCPGRFILETHNAKLSPAAVLDDSIAGREYRVTGARDVVVVVVLDDGGLISYKRTDGTYLHTINTAEGFARKLAQLGIRL